MLEWSVDALRAAGIDDIVVALPPAIAIPDGFALPDGVTGVAGGRERSHSVRAALDASRGGRRAAAGSPSVASSPAGDVGSAPTGAVVASMQDDLVLVHDAARPLVTPSLIEAAIAALVDDPDLAAAIVAAPVTDTVKRSFDGLHAAETLDRSELWAVQTPQVFRRDWLRRALSAPDDLVGAATDDASLVEALGGRVGLVRSTPENFKITTPHDLRVAELLLGERVSGR